MNSENARIIAKAWGTWQADEDEVNEMVVSALAAELTALLSESAETGLASAIGGEVLVLALEGERLIQVRAAESGRTGRPFIATEAIHLVPGMTLQVYTDHLKDEDNEERHYLRRAWKLVPPNAKPIDLTTFAATDTPLSTYGESGDRLMQQVARKLGWPIPENDPPTA